MVSLHGDAHKITLAEAGCEVRRLSYELNSPRPLRLGSA
jgi:hypothetical protein